MQSIKLIPDGQSEIPYEATDDEIVANHLQSVSNWRDIERVTPGSHDYLELRVPDNFDEENREEAKEALVENIDGLKPHPHGWESANDPSS